MITLEDVEVLTGLSTRGLPVTGRTYMRTATEICEEWLGVAPPGHAVSGATMKVPWVKGLFVRLPAGATPEVVTIYAWVFTWVLVWSYYWLTRLGTTYQRTSCHLLVTPLL
ncbi:hypothetical protein LINPERHAP1_LOCUS8290 [Linum perenne]